ncbi:MAG: TIGR04282 family arsenosugar biosynthesis glycosyltransferase [Acidobacteriota bacterium]|nr:TIGR04282 family arsenosugar biosynthesis glycosyltransferase [Acidobacteriota bacterium]
MPDLVIALFGRAPSDPDTKTRLRHGLPASRGAGLPACLLRDTAAVAAQVAAADLAVVCTPGSEPALAEMHACVPGARHVLGQRGADLGERMHHAFVDLFARGYRRVVLIGTDLPTLPSVHLAQAAGALTGGERPRVVLGPAEDGGYYLIGLAGPEPRLFGGIAWSTPRVLEQTVGAALRIGLEVVRLPFWYDVDTPEDLARLRAESPGLPGDVAPFTRGWLAESPPAASPSRPPGRGRRSRH